MSGKKPSLAFILCAVMLQGCGSASIGDATDDQSIPGDNSESFVNGDGSGPSSGDGSGPEPGSIEDDEPEIIAPEGDSSVIVDDRQLPLASALGDIWGVDQEHYNINFTLTNGKFTVESMEMDGVTQTLLKPASATAIVYAEMFSPGEQFSFSTYGFSPFGDGGGVLAGTPFFADAYVGCDINDSGEVEEDEKLAVTGGTMVFSGILPDIELSFSVTLEGGHFATGHYTGLFDFTERK